jgi:hypothetical protein
MIKKKASPAQLAARKKFVEMVRAKAKAKKTATKKATVKKTATKKATVKKVSGLDKVVRRGKKTDVKYSRVSGVEIPRYNIDIHTDDDSLTRYYSNTLISAKKIAKAFGIPSAANTYRKYLENNLNVSVIIVDNKKDQMVCGYSVFLDKKCMVKYKYFNLL